MTISNISGLSPSGARDIANKTQIDSHRGDTIHHAELRSSETQQTDGVQLTAYSTRLREVEASLAEETGVDEKRVEALRKAVASGEYHIDATRTANKLLGFENELFK